MEFDFRKFFKLWSISAICVRKRFGSDKISLFVGVGLWEVARVTTNFDDDVGGVVVGGEVGFVESEGVGRRFGGGAEVGVDLVFTDYGY